MKMGQILTLVAMVIIVIILFSVIAVMGISLMNPEGPGPGNGSEIGGGPSPTSTLIPTFTATPTPIPTNTFTPTPTDTAVPTPTATRVVHDTATPTPSNTPTKTPIPAAGSSSNSSSGGSTSVPAPTPTPTSRYPFQVIDGPIEYETENYFVVVLAKVTRNNVAYLPDYKLVGFHSPTGQNWESAPSCNQLCKASGPEAIYDEDGKKIKDFMIQEGNLVYEFPFYETGTLTLMVVDPQGRQASEVFQLQLDRNEDQRRWFYMHFNQQLSPN